MNKVLTVIIPTYNIEKYIRKCLDSFIIEDIMRDIEVLIVNDGSKDTSVSIAKEFEEKYPNTFRIINKENGGHGSTINRGIIEAKGRYFKVVDGDDWVDKTAFIKLVTFLKRTNSDIVASNFYWVDHKSGKKKAEFKEPFKNVIYFEEYNFAEIFDKIFIKMHSMTIKTNVLKEKIPNLDEHCFYVDMEYVLFPIPYIKTVTFIPEYVYMYRVGLPNQSMNITRMQKNEENYDRVLKRLLGYYKKQEINKIENCYMTYFENVIGRMIASRVKIFLSFPYSNDVKKKIKEQDEYLRKNYPKVYSAVRNKAVILLRKSNYHLYHIAHFSYKVLERLKV